MSHLKHASYEMVPTSAHEATLELVVPFTTPELTRAALRAADRLGAGLNSSIRLLRFQTVPFPLQANESPVMLEFLMKQLRSFRSALPISAEIVLTRNFESALKDALQPHSVVVLATRRRPWRTRNERLAARLAKNGHKAVLVGQDINA